VMDELCYVLSDSDTRDILIVIPNAIEISYASGDQIIDRSRSSMPSMCPLDKFLHIKWFSLSSI